MDPRFAPGNGRPRPEYRPKKVACPHCGSPLDIKDERSRLVVCSHCNTQLEADGSLDNVTLKVLGQQADGKQFGFALEIGNVFTHQKVRYEVIGRMVVEDAEWPDPDEWTHQYLLYHPRRGSLWLSSYQGRWDLTHTSRVQPVTDPRPLSKGAELQTHDGRSWVMVEVGNSKIRYVDGALPWVAQVGEVSHYAELMDKDGKGEIYEVEYRQGEQEVGRGRWLTVDEVRRATGKDIPKPRGKRENVALQGASYRWLMKAASLILFVHLLLFMISLSYGKKVLTQQFSTEDLRGEVLSNPFEVADDGNVIKVSFKAPLSNAWMSIDWGVVQGDDKVIHVDDRDLEYYHGKEGGESWSEGSRSDSTYLKIDQAGTYRLLVRAMSARGNAIEAQASHVPLQVRVKDGAKEPVWLGVTLFLNFMVWIFCIVLYFKWKKGDEED